MVTTSGFPKSGTHALEKAVQLLGQPCQAEHLLYGAPVHDKHIFIKRDPRNIVCSWLRFNRKSVTPGMFLSSFRQFQSASLVEEMAAYVGWLDEGNTLVVRYEELIASDVCMRGIADYLEVPYLSGAFTELEGLTITWFAVHSDYRKLWTPEIQNVWSAEGGPELLTRWGYDG